MSNQEFEKTLAGLDSEYHERYLQLAYEEAEKSATEAEVPAGCVIVQLSDDGLVSKVIARAHNMTEGLKDPTAHAEILAITQAANAIGDWRLTNCILYVTKEPCPMCAGAIVLARLPLVVWGVSDPKRGGHTEFGIFDNPGINHHPEVISGIMEEECLAQLQAFFKARRSENSK